MIELRLSYEEIIDSKYANNNAWENDSAIAKAQLSKACWGIVGWLIQTSNEHTKEDGELSTLTRDILHIVAEQIGIWLHSQGIERYENK